MGSDADKLRGLTRFADNRSVLLLANDVEVDVELCPGARVYSVTLSYRSDAAVIPDIGAILKLQDSQIELPTYGCAVGEVRADLSPPLGWPLHSKLIAPPGSFVTLHAWYGQCKS